MKETIEFTNSNQIFNYKSLEKYEKEFTMVELESDLKNLKIKSAPGHDKISNKILKNLDNTGKIFLLKLFNKSFRENSIPKTWKLAKIVMIMKKADDLHNTNNYRPISLTSAIAKILERLIKARLVDFLESNNLLSKYQSGFRSNRRVIDNIFFFKQKCLEAFFENKKVASIFFDIEKAFDKTWIEGLLLKMHHLKIPTTMAKWIKNFLTDRKFYVSVENEKSKEYPILTLVPQGSILSPILFLIFINDVPLSVENYPNSKGLLFADDLKSFYADKNLNRINIVLQKYLNKLEQWLKKWRLKVAPSKCSYNIYTKSGTCRKNLNLTIFGQKINKENNARYLGIYLDNNLNFIYHVKKIKDKCMRKINFLKTLNSHKNTCSTRTKLSVYFALVRSNLDCAGPLFHDLSYYNKKTLKSIQYHSMRTILKKKFGSSDSEMTKVLGIESLDTHFLKLKKRYLTQGLTNNSLIYELSKDHLQFKSEKKITGDQYSIV